MSRDLISSHVSNDDPRLYSFARTSGLPLNYFGQRRRITASGVLWTATAALALTLLAMVIL